MNHRRRFLISHVFPAIFALCSILSAFSALGDVPGTASPRPNIVVILIDDMGWRDLACYGSRFYETPRIDRLARRGMRFTDAYSACTVCSPSRAAIMTGKYPARLHLTDWIPGYTPQNTKRLVPDWTKRLELEETTLAEVLKSAGYATAHVGKWHLGDEAYYPQHQGFDINIGGDHSGQPASHFWPYNRMVNGKPVGNSVPISGGKKGEYLTDRLTDESLRFIQKQKDGPFFLYLAHYAVHMPLQAKRELIDYYRKKLDESGPFDGQRCPVYAAMIHSVDQSVGRIMDALERHKIADNTIVIFTSDNGGLTWPFCDGQPVTDNSPLRSGKGSPYEGGIRVPLIIDWPGVVEPDSKCEQPVIGADLFPTILGMAGICKNSNNTPCGVDGESLVPLLKQTGWPARDAIYWHYPHYHLWGSNNPHSTVREGDFCLIEFLVDNHIELYNLKEDIGQKHNLAKLMPQKAERLHRKLKNWQKNVDAQFPKPNPNYDPNKTIFGKARPR